MIKTREQNIITKVCRRRKGFNFKTLESVMILAVEITREKKNQFLNAETLGGLHYKVLERRIFSGRPSFDRI